MPRSILGSSTAPRPKISPNWHLALTGLPVPLGSAPLLWDDHFRIDDAGLHHHRALVAHGEVGVRNVRQRAGGHHLSTAGALLHVVLLNLSGHHRSIRA